MEIDAKVMNLKKNNNNNGIVPKVAQTSIPFSYNFARRSERVRQRKLGFRGSKLVWRASIPFWHNFVSRLCKIFINFDKENGAYGVQNWYGGSPYHIGTILFLLFERF